ncbi:hypothetical protein HI914_06674 [Erysiphe necator]|nr:hypothetical protein HI914_06674 [Erysiphe necator]
MTRWTKNGPYCRKRLPKKDKAFLADDITSSSYFNEETLDHEHPARTSCDLKFFKCNCIITSVYLIPALKFDFRRQESYGSAEKKMALMKILKCICQPVDTKEILDLANVTH